MKTIYFDHIHTVRTDGRRERTDAQRLAALRWPRFTFGEFYLIDSPPFLSLWFALKRKMPPFDPFSFLSKKHVFAVFQPCSDHNRLRPGFRHCSHFVPVFLCPRLVSWRPGGRCLLNKTKKQSNNVSVYPLFCVQWLLTTVSHDLSFWLVVICRSTGSIQMRFLRKNCGDFPYF